MILEQGPALIPNQWNHMSKTENKTAILDPFGPGVRSREEPNQGPNQGRTQSALDQFGRDFGPCQDRKSDRTTADFLQFPPDFNPKLISFPFYLQSNFSTINQLHYTLPISSYNLVPTRFKAIFLTSNSIHQLPLIIFSILISNNQINSTNNKILPISFTILTYPTYLTLLYPKSQHHKFNQFKLITNTFKELSSLQSSNIFANSLLNNHLTFHYNLD